MVLSMKFPFNISVPRGEDQAALHRFAKGSSGRQ